MRVTFVEALVAWTRIGLESFGGPAGQIAVMHRVVVEEKRWLSEERFLHALNYCMLLPGPEAQQLATYLGWLLHGVRGGLAAGLLFILPGAFAMLGLSWLYVAHGNQPDVAAVFFGVKAAVLAIVIDAVVRIGRRALRTPFLIGIAAAAFVAIFAFRVAFPWIGLGAGLLGVAAGRLRPRWIPRTADAGDSARSAGSGVDDEPLIDAAFRRGVPEHARPSAARALRTLGAGVLLWAAPVAAAAALLGGGHVLVRIGLVFSLMAVVTFGGAYAALAYVAQEAVARLHWLGPGEMLDGLGLAETTPGPLILVLQFVGFVAAHRAPGTLPPHAAALLGAAMTAWVTFTPCFLWIFLGAPYVEALRGRRALDAALACITAAVVGVILNLAAFFGLHTLFLEATTHRAGIVRLEWPVASSLDPAAAALALLAAVLLLGCKRGVVFTLVVCAAIGWAWRAGGG